jgi:DNA-binding MarR family transcriptional regulator
MSISLTVIAGLVGALTRSVHSGRAHYAKARGLEPGSSHLLSKLAEHGALRSTDLTLHACVDASVVSRQIKSLISNGLVQRIPDPIDGRAALLEVTETGLKVLAQSRETSVQFFEQVFAKWSKQEIAEFERLFGRFVEDMNREIQNFSQNQEIAKIDE